MSIADYAILLAVAVLAYFAGKSAFGEKKSSCHGNCSCCKGCEK